MHQIAVLKFRLIQPTAGGILGSGHALQVRFGTKTRCLRSLAAQKSLILRPICISLDMNFNFPFQMQTEHLNILHFDFRSR